MVKYFIISILIFAGCGSSDQINHENKATVEKSESKIEVKNEEPIQEYWDVNQLNGFVVSENNRITACYENVKVKNPNISGSLVIRARFNPVGKVDSFVVVTDNIHNSELKNCIQNTVMKWKSPKVDAVKNKPVWLEIPYDFTDFSNHSSELRTEEEIVQFATSKKSDLFSCITSNEISIEITVTFEILPNGKVENVSIKQSNLTDADIEDCILRRIKFWSFEPIQSDKRQQVTLPFVFSK